MGLQPLLLLRNGKVGVA